MFVKKQSKIASSGHERQRLTASGRTEAVASSIQQRIYMHEHLYFRASNFSMYNFLIPLSIKRGSLSIEHIRLSLLSVMKQHTILRTAVRFNPVSNQIEQYIQPLSDSIYSFQHSQGVSTLEQLDHLLTYECIGKHFDVEQGNVFRCHVVQRSDVKHDHSLHEGDLIIFVIHHIAFDLSSNKPFIEALRQACCTGDYCGSTLSTPQYIDFALHEQAMLADTSVDSKMNQARRFWSNLLHEYDWSQRRHLVPHEYRTDQIRSGRGYSASFIFDQDIVDAMMLCASSNNMFSLTLACYYAFLFKLINGNDDLCVVGNVANRPEEEMKDIIGMFVNLLPYRMKVEPNKSFDHLMRKVQQLSNDILLHASLPYQQIIDSQDQRGQQILPSMSFQYDSLIASLTQKNTTRFTLSEDSLVGVYYDRNRSHGNGISFYDITLTIAHDHYARSTECFLDCSADVFENQTDVDLLMQRFQQMLPQLFLLSMIHEPIDKLNIVLPIEQNLIQQLNDTLLFSTNSCTDIIHEQSAIERQILMNAAEKFWFDTLHSCRLDQPILLPCDRYRLANEHRTGRGTSVSFDLGQDLSHHLFIYASFNNLSIKHLTLSIYFVFLFKLSNRESDLCIGMNTHGRYRDGLQSPVGLFENLVPLRCQLDPHWSFHQLLKYVNERTINSMKYSYLPLQRILAQHSHISNPGFLDTSFEFTSFIGEDDNNEIMIGDGRLCSMPVSLKISEDEIMNKFDFILSMQHDMNINQLSCKINASLDLFDVETIALIAQRFHSVLEELFNRADDQMQKSLYELSLVLPDERTLIKSMNTTQVSFPAVDCIHHAFVCQVMKHPQKLAVELDDQSVTYAELLYYTQVLSLTLLNEYLVVPGEIICQCVERSLSMVIGMMAIEMVGGVYCPLSPRDPQQRLYTLVHQTCSRLVLTHDQTKTKFNEKFVSVDIDSSLTNNDEEYASDIDRLSNILVTSENIGYCIFTSGSTGIPKAVPIRHRNLMTCIDSVLRVHLLSNMDTMLQMASCSYDVHVQEIAGALTVGASVIMLHPQGHMDHEYVIRVSKEKHVSYLQCVPAYLNSLLQFLKTSDDSKLNTLRTLDIGGDTSSVQLIKNIKNHLSEDVSVWNTYGPAEATINCTFHVIDIGIDSISIPMGCPLPHYRCVILDDFYQSIFAFQEGELLVGGVGVFTGYLGRDDLTTKALIVIDDEVFYRTGDLVRIDDNGLLHYQGRKDHQVKLHGQRIELGEIERCLLSTSISACVVIKYGDDHLVAYVQSSHIDEQQLREHCQSHLPPHMIPSLFIILDKLPLNANGKIDRKVLPAPQFSVVDEVDCAALLTLTPLEEHLRRIFGEAFHCESPNVNTSFGQMGGTSLDAIRAVWLIRQEVCTKMDAGLLFANPSIRQLARAIEPLLDSPDELVVATTTSQLEEDQDRAKPCLYIEIVGIILLMCQWILPIGLAYHFDSLSTLLFVPIFHLLSYVICRRLLFRPEEAVNNVDQLYSWYYYRWWFMNSMWSINSSYWLKHLLGTPFYNAYLRLCGARIGCHSHICTVLIDAPWLVEIGDYTFIGEEVVLSNLSYHAQTYELHRIQIGAHCTISTRSVLYENVVMEDCTYVEPMSTITGLISTSNHCVSAKDRLISSSQSVYQFACLLSLIFIHSIVLVLAYAIYSFCSTLLLPLPISLALCWLIWTLASLVVALFLLRFIVGSVTSGHYPLNSYSYLHKIWLRQLVITSFHHGLDWIPSYDTIASTILRWLGAHIGDDVKFAEFRQILYFPSNLLRIQSGVTTFGGAKLAPFAMSKEGLCHVDEIHLGPGTNLTNWCTVMPGTRLPSTTMVGSLTLVTPETASRDDNRVLLGIPAREMPFVMPSPTSLINDLSSSSSSDSLCLSVLQATFLSFFISKYLMITLYSLLPMLVTPLVHVMILSIFIRCCILFIKRHPDSKLPIFIQKLLHQVKSDFVVSIGPYLSGTQLLVWIFRVIGAQIGRDVILPNEKCLTDPHLTTIGDHVRLHRGAHIQCHTFEQRLFKLAPVTVDHSSVIMSNALILSGSTLQGHNRILPLTLVLKDDQLLSNTNWSGVPAHRLI